MRNIQPYLTNVGRIHHQSHSRGMQSTAAFEIDDLPPPD